MRKFLVFIIVLFLSVNYWAAAHSDCGGHGGLGDEGFSVGLEFGIDAVNDDDRMPFLTGIVSFGHSFLDDKLDFYSELSYTIGFAEGHHDHSHNGDGSFPQSLYFNLMLGYNLYLGVDEESTLSFILQNEFDEFILSPRCDEDNNITGIFTPAVRFNQELNTGDLYAQIGLPITYVQNEKDADTVIGLDFTVGWSSLFGLEFEVTLFTVLAPGDDSGFDGIELLVGYELEPFHFSIETFIPLNEFDHRGLNIKPQIEYGFGNFNFFVNCGFAGIGIHENGGGHGHSLHITPALGVKYTF